MKHSKDTNVHSISERPTFVRLKPSIQLNLIHEKNALIPKRKLKQASLNNSNTHLYIHKSFGITRNIYFAHSNGIHRCVWNINPPSRIFFLFMYYSYEQGLEWIMQLPERVAILYPNEENKYHFRIKYLPLLDQVFFKDFIKTNIYYSCWHYEQYLTHQVLLVKKKQKTQTSFSSLPAKNKKKRKTQKMTNLYLNKQIINIYILKRIESSK